MLPQSDPEKHLTCGRIETTCSGLLRGRFLLRQRLSFPLQFRSEYPMRFSTRAGPILNLTSFLTRAHRTL